MRRSAARSWSTSFATMCTTSIRAGTELRDSGAGAPRAPRTGRKSPPLVPLRLPERAERDEAVLRPALQLALLHREVVAGPGLHGDAGEQERILRVVDRVRGLHQAGAGRIRAETLEQRHRLVSDGHPVHVVRVVRVRTLRVLAEDRAVELH